MCDKKTVVYVVKDALDEIIILSDFYPNWNVLLRKHAILCIDLSEDEFNEIWNVDNDIFIFCQGNDIPTPIPLSDYFTSLKEDYSQVIDKPRSMFILNEDKTITEQIQKNYGIVVQSKGSIDDNIVFSLKHYEELSKGDIIEGVSNGWSNLIKSKVLPPSNAIIISDKYLFANTSNGKLYGEVNILKLLGAILPYDLLIPFQVLVVSEMPSISEEKINELAGRLKTNISELRDFKIQLEFVFSDTIHKRKLFSNYYSIKCDKGFAMFYIDKEKEVKDDDTDFDLMANFYAIRDNTGDSEYYSASKRLSIIKKVCSTLKEQINAGINDHTKNIMGDCNSDKSINNRLLQSIK